MNTLEEEIKIHEHVSSVVAEVGSVLRVGDVVVHLQWIGMVGDVAKSERETDGMLRVDVEVLRNAGICR